MNSTFYVFNINTDTGRYQLDFDTKDYGIACKCLDQNKRYIIATFNSDGSFYYLRGKKGTLGEPFEISNNKKYYLNGFECRAETLFDFLKENDKVALEFSLFNIEILEGLFNI